MTPAELAAIKAVWLPPTNLHWNPTSRVQAGRAATDIAALLDEVERLNAELGQAKYARDGNSHYRAEQYERAEEAEAEVARLRGAIREYLSAENGLMSDDTTQATHRWTTAKKTLRGIAGEAK